MRKRATANVEMVEEGTSFKCALCHKIGLKGIRAYRAGSRGIYICEKCLEKKMTDAEAKMLIIHKAWLEVISGTPYYQKYLDIQAECEKRCLMYGINAGSKWYREEMDRVFTQEVHDELRRLKGL